MVGGDILDPQNLLNCMDDNSTPKSLRNFQKLKFQNGTTKNWDVVDASSIHHLGFKLLQSILDN